MAIRPVDEPQAPPIEPLCALKVGSFNCFCMWTPNGTIDASTEAHLMDGSVSSHSSPDRSSARLPNRESEARRKLQDDSTDAGSETTAGASSGGYGQASSMDAPVAIDHPLLSTVRLNLGERSRFLQELAKIGSAAGDPRNIDAIIWEQVRRMAVQHDEALVPSDIDSNEWQVLEQGGEGGIEFGHRNVGGTVHWFRSMDCPESDIVKGFAAFLEVDLCASFIEDLIMAEPLGMHTAKRDSVWRTVIQGVGVKQDNVWVHSAVDALEEPVRSLLVFSSTTQKPPGLLLVPPPMAGFNRADFECTITRLQPLRRVSERPSGGPQVTPFRLTQSGVYRPYAARGAAPVTPSLEETSRKTKTFSSKLIQFLERTGRLDQRITMSPRTELYNRVRKHIDNMPIKNVPS